MASNSLIGNLAVNLSLQTAAFQRGATIAEKRAQAMHKKIGGVVNGLKGFGAALAGSLAIGAVTNAINRGLEYASSLGEVAQQLGVTTKTLQEYRYAATQAGISQDEMDKGLAKLTRSLGELQQGSKPMADAFAQIGLSAQQLAGVETGDAFRMIADGLSKIADPAKRAAIEVDIFGRAGQKLDTLLAGGSSKINELTNAAQKLGIVLSDEQIQNADKTADKMAAMKQVMEAKIAGIVSENADAILKLADTLGKMAVGIANGIAKISQWISTANSWLVSLEQWSKAVDAAVVGAFTRMWQGAVGAVQKMYEGVKTWTVDKLGAVFDALRAKVKAVGDAFLQLYDRVVGHSYVPDMVDEIGDHVDRLDGEMVDPALDATNRTAEGFANMAQNIVGSLGNIGRSIKSGDWLGALEGVLSAIPQISGLFGKSGNVFGSYPSGGAIGMARGGSGIFGGRPGIDRNTLSLNGSPIARVSRGERFAVSPNNDNGGGRIAHIVPSPYFDVVVDGRAQRVAAPLAGRAAIVGSAGAQSALARRRQRLIP